MPVQTQRGGRGISPTHCSLGTRKGWCSQYHALAALPLGRPSTLYARGWVGIGTGLGKYTILAATPKI